MNRNAMMILGLNGLNEQTAAVRALVTPKGTTRRRKKTTTRKKRRTTAAKRRAPARKKRATRRTKKPAYMVKGSPAAKRRMAQLRKMRRR